jgi:phospholipase C
VAERKRHNSGITRRGFLGGALGAAAVAGFQQRWLHRVDELVRHAASIAPAARDVSAVEHVVIVMQENRSFDHYFGMYPGVRGFEDHRGKALGAFAQGWADAPSRHAPHGQLLPYHLDTATLHAQCAGNADVPIHDWGPQHLSWAKGKMDAFVATHSRDEFDGPQQGPLVMAYLNRLDLPFYWALADAFTICDAYHCSVIGPTMPNRLYSWSATIDPSGRNGGPVISTPGFAESPAAIASVQWPTMPERLLEHKVSWKVYQPPGTSAGPGQSANLAIGFNALLYFKQYLDDPKSELYQRAFLPVWPDEFTADVANNTLPQVSWMIPSLVDSEHPSAAPDNGQAHVRQIIETLVSHPDVWAKTVVFVTYDENGGFFDHVPPPVAPAGTAGEELTVDPLPRDALRIKGPIGLGFRVPALVVSSFSRGGHVNSDLFDHTSLLRFLETRFGVQVPNLTSWRRGTVGDLTSTLDLRAVDTSAPPLPAIVGDSPALAGACPANQSPASLLAPPPTLTIPCHQEMPRQEAARRRK